MSGDYFVGTSANRSPNTDTDHRSHGSDVSDQMRDLDFEPADSVDSSGSASGKGASQGDQLNDVSRFMNDLLALREQSNYRQD